MGYLQKLFGLVAVASVLNAYSIPASADVQTWTFDKSSQSFSKANTATQTQSLSSVSKPKKGRVLNLTSSNGVHMTMGGYSDTKEVAGGADKIKRGKLIWASDTSLGLRNKDEKQDFKEATNKAENKSSPQRGIDNISRTNDTDGTFDMVLLEFDTAVSLSALTLAWAAGGNADGTADISILAYTGDGSDALLKNTWGGILGSGSGNGFDLVGNYSNVNLSYFAVNPDNITSTKWLIGVYNPIFGTGGDAGDDAFKLAAIETTLPVEDEDPQDVSVPGTLVLLMVGLLVLGSGRYLRATRKEWQ